tara:strand:+ start:4686 stop:5222 length:537 start_codon:yes stop_codon:yes gene_type:complete
MTDNESIEETKSQDDDASKDNPEDATAEKSELTWEEKYNDAYDALLRAKAEVENIKKRSEKEISNAYKFSTEGIFLDLIPIFESLDIAVSQDTNNTNKENLIEGNKLLKNMFDSLLDKNSLQVIDPIGEKFDPNLHQAIKTVKNDSKENNTIDEVLQKGYKLVDRVIKPALVVVIKNT